MSDLINRKEVIKVVDDLKITIEPDVIEEYTLYQVLAILVKKIESNLVDRINKIPTIEAKEVVHWEWIFKNDGAYRQRRAYCSVCGKRSGIGGIESNQRKPFCPNCGADMRKGGAE